MTRNIVLALLIDAFLFVNPRLFRKQVDLAFNRRSLFRRLVVEDGAAAQVRGDFAFVLNGGGEIGDGVEIGFDVAGEFVEAAEAFEFFGVAEFGGVEGAPKDGEGFVICLQRDREGMAVFAAVSEGEAGGIGEAAGRAVDNFSDKCEGLECARAETFDQ